MQQNKFSKVLKNWILPVFLALFFAFIIQVIVIKSYKYSGGSMEPSIYNGDYIFVKKTRSVKIDDIVLIQNPLSNQNNELLFKRCVALSGDTLEISNGTLFVNNVEFKSKGNITNSYRILAFDTISEFAVTKGFYGTNNYSVTGMYKLVTNFDVINKMIEDSIIKNVQKIYIPKGYNNSQIFPYSFQYRWNQDNFGPMIIPEKGQTVFLNETSLPLYRQIITYYENNEFAEENDKLFINGEETQYYTFKQNYIFVLNDNRSDISDSRVWGLIPENIIKGKAEFIWFSNKSLKRIFKKL